MKKFAIFLIILLSIVAVVVYAYSLYRKAVIPKVILTFQDCVIAGNLVVDTRPRECHTKTGQLYIEQDNHVSLKDYIQVTDPQPYAYVTTPFKVAGQAKGIWYGNKRLNVKLVDPNMHVIAEKTVFALSDTSRNTMVPFVAAVDFNLPAGLTSGLLLIEKTSGVDIPDKNGPLIIPVSFK